MTISALLLLILSIGLFACKDKDAEARVTKEELAARTVDAIAPEGAENAKLASDLLSLLDEAGLEEAETTAVLTALLTDKEATKYYYALFDLSEKVFRSEHAATYRETLSKVAQAVSPEVAGAVYYAAAKRENDSLPYTLEDCRKLASLLLSQNAAFNADLLESSSKGDALPLSEKEATTAVLSLAASLRKAVGVTQGAKDYLYERANAKIGELVTESEETSAETKDALLRLRTLVGSLVTQLRDNYDLALTFAAEYLSAAGARILLGQPYERRECTVYYGYRYADWSKTPISQEDYLARRGDYDEYLAIESNVKGFTVNGEFVIISDQDAETADRIYRLNVAYRTYSLLGESEKAQIRTALPDLLAILGENQGVVAELTGRPIIDDSGAPASTLEELLTVLPQTATYDVTDGITDEERSAAANVTALFESYLHGYMPRVY